MAWLRDLGRDVRRDRAKEQWCGSVKYALGSDSSQEAQPQRQARGYVFNLQSRAQLQSHININIRAVMKSSILKLSENYVPQYVANCSKNAFASKRFPYFAETTLLQVIDVHNLLT